jgi:hypothetical protein
VRVKSKRKSRAEALHYDGKRDRYRVGRSAQAVGLRDALTR